ncbi:MAG: DNA primase [Desulfobacterales bacterium]|nr:MAG: DNA primase [Desulfobacterales bacterium]
MQTTTEEFNLTDELEKIETGQGGCEQVDYSFFAQAKKIYDLATEGESGAAKVFTGFQRGKFCYDHASRQWFKFNGSHWELDYVNEVLSRVESVATEYAKVAKHFAAAKTEAIQANDNPAENDYKELENDTLKAMRRLLNLKTRENVLTLAAAGKDSLGITGNEWDRDPWVLGCKNGVIDLKTGELKSGKPEDYIKTVAPVEWQGIDASCPLWERFLLEIFNGDTDTTDFMQRLFGYSITGTCKEHIYPVAWGIGRNGKGTTFEVLSSVLGELAGPMESEMILEQKFKRHSGGPASDIIHLRGKRIVWASESGEGRNLDSGKLKWLTGGDTLTGRAPYGRRQVTFRPTHTLFLLTNHKPHANTDDYALWNRVLLIPFTLSFVDEPTAANERKKDGDLADKLKAEASGILAWLVRGCLEYQRIGLSPPESIKAATREYQQDEDILGHFIEDCCILGDNLEVKAGDLYQAYVKWCGEMGHKAMSGTRFGREMKRRFDSYKPNYVFYIGIGLRANGL